MNFAFFQVVCPGASNIFPHSPSQMEADVHDILIVLYRSGEVVVKVGEEPNKGKKIEHGNIVKHDMKTGQRSGGDFTLVLPAPKSSIQDEEEAVTLVQAGSGGLIVGAVKN